MLRPSLFCFVFAWIILSSKGQTLTEKLIISDTRDSILLNAEFIKFGANGEYLFDLEKNKKRYFITEHGKYGPFEMNWASDIAQFVPPKNPHALYYTSNSHRLCGPIKGVDIAHFRHPFSSNVKHFAIPILRGDSIYIYLDGMHIFTVDTLSSLQMTMDGHEGGQYEKKRFAFETSANQWMDLSNKGDFICDLENGLIHRLYINSRLIDSSSEKFEQFRINTAGHYIYAQGQSKVNADSSADYMYYIHTRDTVVGPVRTVWYCGLNENGGYYYHGDDNGPSYIIVNNRLYKGLESVSNINVLDRDHYLFTYTENGKTMINVNGKSYLYSYDEIFYPSLDNKGNFAFYGQRGYYLYKFVNGTEVPLPLSKYGVRATPLYINPKGISIHYFRTDDSIYLYRDDELLMPPVLTSEGVVIKSYADLSQATHIDASPNQMPDRSLFYLGVGTTGYIIWNGIISKPILSPNKQWYDLRDEIGSLVINRINQDAFFVLQKTNQNGFELNVNNQFYKKIEGLSGVVKDSIFFDGKKLVFVGTKGLGFYQYTLTL
jgi:hypothetical protein